LVDSPLGPGEFAKATTAEAVAAFSIWLNEMVDRGILEIVPGEPFGVAPWQDIYIESAYKRGILAADNALRSRPGAVASLDPQVSVSAAFSRPVHADRVGIAFTTAGAAMRGATDAMISKIQQIVALGLADGKGPAQISKIITDTIHDIGRVRARTIARTETIRAHHLANVAMLREAGISGVTVLAEWSTASFGVCPDCAWMNGRLFTIDEIETLIPLHPNCRCVALPADVGEDDDSRGAFEESTIAPEYFRKDGSLKFRDFYSEKTGKSMDDLPGRTL
jgi:SPP1 gp7 family putative phage head morphogenesis protein